MRELVERYLKDGRVRALADAYQRGSGVVIGACQDAFAPVLVAALEKVLIADGATRGPGLIVCNNPDDVADDFYELGMRAAVLHDIDDWDTDTVANKLHFFLKPFKLQ